MLEIAMTSPPAAGPEPRSNGFIRRIAVFVLIGVLMFGVLWYTIFSAVTAALIAAGGTGMLVVGTSVSDVFESLFEMLANIILGILAAIVAFFAAIFSIFE
jgi:choline-glycine betaine transporter